MGILLSNFQNKLSKLTDSELTAFDALDNNPELLLSSNLTRLAEKLYTSNSSLIRLTQKLGFEGFREFKQEVKRLLDRDQHSEKLELLAQYQSLLTSLSQPENEKKLGIFAEQIHVASNLFIVGLGLTKPVAEYMAKHLYQLDRASIYVYESHMLDLLPNLVRSGDLVIVFSMSGETASLIDSIGKVARSQATLLSITNSLQNRLNQLTKSWIASELPENYYHSYDVSSRGFLLIIADLILDIYYHKYLN